MASHAPTREAGDAPPRRTGPSLESLFIAALALFGMRLGARPITDNSEFVHLRTGLTIATGHGIPRTDPYSFTAHGTRWVVQSWLPEATYGLLKRFGSFGWVELEQAVVMALSAWLIVRLARAGTPLRTLLAGAAALGAGSAFWTPRPLMFGVLAFVLAVTVVERRANPWWLVPITWVWVNSHGSFPLGLAWLGAVVLGTAIDTKTWPRTELRYLGTFVVGLAVGAVNPLGPRLLSFAITVEEKRKVFQSVVEWHSPNFQQSQGFFTLVFLILALVVLFQARHALSWRDMIPVLGFLVAGLLALRNLPMLGVALAPVLGRAARSRSETSSASTTSGGGGPANRVLAAGLALLFLLFGINAVRNGGVDARQYPVAAVNYMQRHGLVATTAHRVAEQDIVGCYLDLRYGEQARVFIDDRVDMFPVKVSDDYTSLLQGHLDTLRLLDHYRIDVVLWDNTLPLVTILRTTHTWHQVFLAKGWVVMVRNGTRLRA